MQLNPGDIANLGLVLQNLMDPNNVQQAEAILTAYKKAHPRCILDFMAVIKTPNQNPGVKFQAASAMSKSTKNFKILTPQEQGTFQADLVSVLQSETERTVLSSLCGCVARVYKLLKKSGKDWDQQIFMMIQALSANQNPRFRALNFDLIEHLCEQAPDHILVHVASFNQLFTVGIRDPDVTVRTSCFHAITIFIEQFNIDDQNQNVMVLQPLLGVVLDTLTAQLANGNEDTVVDGLEIFSVCGQSRQPLINDIIPRLMAFLADVICSDSITEEGTKNSAGDTFREIVVNRPKAVGKANLVHQCLGKLITKLAQIPGSAVGSIFNFNASLQEGDDDEEDPTVVTARIIQECIDSMAIHIPKKYFVDVALKMCYECLNHLDANVRKAGCAVLGMITEGTNETIRHHLQSILDIVLQRCQDANPHVKECASFALGQMSEHCQPQILLHHAKIIPAILDNLNPDSTEAVQITTSYVIETFCEPLQAVTLGKYLQKILDKLAALLRSEKAGLKETALSALASVAVASEGQFIPFMGPVIDVLTPFMQLEDEKDINVRGRALECLGHIAIAVGADNYDRYFIPSLQNAVSVLNSTDDKKDCLKEYSFIFIANTAKAMKKKYSPLLGQIFPILSKVADEPESEPYPDGGDDEGEEVLVTVHDGFIANKKASLVALGALAEYTREDFYPFLKPFIELLFKDDGPLDSYHEVIRSEAASVLFQCIDVVKFATMPTFQPKKGEVSTFPPEVKDIATNILAKYISLITSDPDRSTVHAAIQGIELTITSLGITCLAYTLDTQNILTLVTEAMVKVLSNSLPCQKGVEADDEDSDHDNIIMDATCDLVGTLAKTCGAQFLSPYFEKIHVHLLKYLSRSDTEDQAMAIGCYGEVIDEVGAPSFPVFQQIVPFLAPYITSEKESVRRNTAFCIAACITSFGDSFTPENFQTFLQMLAPLCSRPERNFGDKEDIRGGDVDNAIAAVFKIAKKYPAQVPLNHFLPHILTSLPIQNDEKEGKPIYEQLFSYIAVQEPNMMQHLDKCLTVFARVVSPDSQDSQETRKFVRSTFQQAFSSPQFSAMFQAAFAKMDPKLVQELMQQ